MRRMYFIVLCTLLLGSLALGARVQGDDPNAPIVVEAELYDAVALPADPCSLIEFVFDNTVEGYVSAGYMQGIPVRENVKDDISKSPKLDYDIEIAYPGTYYIWVRLNAKADENTIHMGVNDEFLFEEIDIRNPFEAWLWRNVSKSGRLELEATEPGIYTLNIWVRESGALIDKIVVINDPNYTPEGIGPMDQTLVRMQSDDPNDPNGMVAMEAELYAANVPADTNEFEWVTDSNDDFAGFALEGYMRGFPIETNVQSDLARSPRLDYEVVMVKSGTYYIWARALAPTSAQNSIHLGDSGIMTAERLNIPDGGWVWVNETNDGGRAMLTVYADVNEPNMVAVNVWMRESGACVDKLVLTMDPNYVPSETGPRDPLVGGISLYVPPKPIITAVAVDEMTFGVDMMFNVVLDTINGISTQDLILGTTISDKSVMDDFILEGPYDGDVDGVIVTMFDVPVTQIFIVEKDGNDDGYYQPIDAEGNPIGGPLKWDSDTWSDKIENVNADGQDMSGTVITAEEPISGIEIWSGGVDPYSISAVPAQ